MSNIIITNKWYQKGSIYALVALVIQCNTEL